MQRPVRRSNPTAPPAPVVEQPPAPPAPPAPPVPPAIPAEENPQGAEDESGDRPVHFGSGPSHLQGVPRPVAQRGSASGTATSPTPPAGGASRTTPKRLTAFSPVGKGGLMPPSSSDVAETSEPQVAPDSTNTSDQGPSAEAEPVDSPAASDASAPASGESGQESEESGESRASGEGSSDDDGQPSPKRPREDEPEDEEVDENAD